MSVLLPFKPSIGRYRMVTVIDNQQYIFLVRWNSRDEAWYFDILEFDETPIVQGVKVVLGTYLGRYSNHPLLLGGVIIARSREQPHKDPGFDDLGVRVQLYYFNRGDMAAEMFASVSGAT